MRTIIAFILAALFAAGIPVSAGGISRKAAKEKLEENTKRVRALMNSNPEEMGEILGWYMARPIGDDPKILALCDEVIQKSTSPVSALRATSAVGGILAFHRDQIAKQHRKDAVMAVLQHALRHESPLVQLEAARSLERLDKDAMIRAYVNIFRSPNLVRDDHVRWPMVLGVERLLDSGRSDALGAVKYATEKYGLLVFFEAGIKEGRFRGNSNEVLLRRWQEAMRSDR